MDRREGRNVIYWIAPLGAGIMCALLTSILLTLPTKWALASFLGLGIVVAAVLYRDLSRFFLVLLALSVPFASVSHTFFKRVEYFLGTVGIAIGVVEVSLLVLYCLWLLRSVTGQGRKIEFFTAPNLWALSFIVFSSFSIINSTDKALSLFELIRMIKVYLIFFYLANVVESEDVPYVIASLLFGVFVQSIMGIAQYITGSSLGVGLLGGAEENLPLTIGGKEYLRVAGTIHHPNQYAHYLTILLPAALCLLLSVQQRVWVRVSCGVVFVIGLVAMILSFSRTGWISLAVAVMAVLAVTFLLGKLSPKQFMGLFVLGGVGIVVVSAFSRQIIDRMFASDPRAMLIRWELLDAAISMIRQHPLLGVGLNNFIHFLENKDSLGISLPQNVHNIYALIWAETGLFAFLAFLGFVVSLFRKLLRPIRSATGVWQGIALGIGAGLLGSMIDGLTDYSYRMNVVQTLFWFLAGFIVGLHRICLHEGKEQVDSAPASVGHWRHTAGVLP
jgi:O-antigen ligase